MEFASIAQLTFVYGLMTPAEDGLLEEFFMLLEIYHQLASPRAVERPRRLSRLPIADFVKRNALSPRALTKH